MSANKTSGISCPNCHSTEELNLDDQNLHGMFECLDCGSIWDEKHRAKSEWRPIELHPKGQSDDFLVLNPWGNDPKKIAHAYYHEGQLYVAYCGMTITDATHWMPMPEGSEL